MARLRFPNAPGSGDSNGDYTGDPNQLPLDPSSIPPYQTAAPGGTDGGPETRPGGPYDPKTTPTNPVDPNNHPTPTDASGSSTPSLKDRADALLKKYGYHDNGTGSGFGDEGYWLNVLNGLSGSAQDNMFTRWENDLEGKGTDNPGPGDAGNTSHDPNSGMGEPGGSSVFGNAGPGFAGTSLPSAVSPNMGNDSAFLDQILGQLQQFGQGLNPLVRK